MTALVLSQAGNVASSILSRGGAKATVTSSLPPRPNKNNNNVLQDIYSAWFQVSSPIRFAVSGTIGNTMLFFFERMAYHWLCQVDSSLPSFFKTHKDSVSFFLGYIGLLPTQHLLNALLTFGIHTINTREKYWMTLVAQVNVYLFALCGSTILNAILMKTGRMTKTAVFVLTLSIFSCFNYIVINFLVQRTVSKGGEKQAKKLVKIPRGGSIKSSFSSPTSSSSSWHSSGGLSVHDWVVGMGTPVDIEDSTLLSVSSSSSFAGNRSVLKIK